MATLQDIAQILREAAAAHEASFDEPRGVHGVAFDKAVDQAARKYGQGRDWTNKDVQRTSEFIKIATPMWPELRAWVAAVLDEDPATEPKPLPDEAAKDRATRQSAGDEHRKPRGNGNGPQGRP